MSSSDRPFLSVLDASAVTELLALGRDHRHPARSILFFEGDEASTLMVVRSGLVKVVVAAVDGREVVLDILGAGDILGELSAIDGKPRSATATAVTPAHVTTIEVGRFRSFVEANPTVAMALLRSLAARLRSSSHRQFEFGTGDALGRVCGRLVEMMARYGEPVGDQVTISSPLSQAEIAEWAGLSREAAVRALGALRALGWIRSHGRTITVVDVSAVRARASARI